MQQFKQSRHDRRLTMAPAKMLHALVIGFTVLIERVAAAWGRSEATPARRLAVAR